MELQGRIQGGLWGLETPPPEIYQGSQKNDVQGVAPTTPLLHIWLKTSLYLLQYALNLGLGMILVLYY